MQFKILQFHSIPIDSRNYRLLDPEGAIKYVIQYH
jgi:hypothetical protein